MVMRIITFKIDDELLERLDIVAQSMNSSRSEVIRKALLLYLSKAEKELSKKPRIRIIQ
jgi:CopG family transcriptional regulator/antitoxin EndoAI